jgi:hypothetical protein
MNHPLVKNANQYFLEKKFISIHSKDLDPNKFPNTSEFEVTLPQEICNVASARLYSWDFPDNMDLFSVSNDNLVLRFCFTEVFNPGANKIGDPVLEGIFYALYASLNKPLELSIQPGNYTPHQLAIELTNRLNETTKKFIQEYLLKNSNLPFLENGYNRFKVTYNSVAQEFWFGNTADNFTILTTISTSSCVKRNTNSWGLGYHLGFLNKNAEACDTSVFHQLYPLESQNYLKEYGQNSIKLPCFFYENEFWLLPEFTNNNVYFVKAPTKIKLSQPQYIYMEIANMNYIDETPTMNAAFAKIPINNNRSWYDNESGPYKYWNPVAERISKLKIKLRYHNGMLVDFGLSDYSFMLEFNVLKPQQERIYSVVNAYDLSQQQTFS